MLALALGCAGSIREAESLPKEQSRRQAGPMAVWFSHEWEIRDAKKPSYVEPTRLEVKLFKTPGRELGKAGEQSVLKIYRNGKVIFSSDQNRQCKDNICFGEPVSIVRVGADKMAIITQGPTAYIGTSVFAFHDEKVKLLLTAGSKLMPEFVYPAKFIARTSPHNENRPATGIEPRIITTESVKFTEGGMIPVTANVFEWDEQTNSYRNRREVDWNSRLEGF